jgi:hypothetical protein
VAEGGCFGVLNGSPNWEKRREVFLVFTGSDYTPITNSAKANWRS